jgi:hypothetical protein
MTTFGLIPFDARPPLQLLLGLALMALPFVLGIEPAGAVVGVVAGVAVVGVALSSVRGERGLPALPLSAVQSFDWGVVLGLSGAALALGLAGHLAAAVLLAAFGAAHLVLTLTTRWTLRA